MSAIPPSALSVRRSIFLALAPPALQAELEGRELPEVLDATFIRGLADGFSGPERDALERLAERLGSAPPQPAPVSPSARTFQLGNATLPEWGALGGADVPAKHGFILTRYDGQGLDLSDDAVRKLSGGHDAQHYLYPSLEHFVERGVSTSSERTPAFYPAITRFFARLAELGVMHTDVQSGKLWSRLGEVLPEGMEGVWLAARLAVSHGRALGEVPFRGSTLGELLSGQGVDVEALEARGAAAARRLRGQLGLRALPQPEVDVLGRYDGSGLDYSDDALGRLELGAGPPALVPNLRHFTQHSLETPHPRSPEFFPAVTLLFCRLAELDRLQTPLGDALLWNDLEFRLPEGLEGARLAARLVVANGGALEQQVFRGKALSTWLAEAGVSVDSLQGPSGAPAERPKGTATLA